jgi:NtrC-family two-component system response regulator AlgB
MPIMRLLIIDDEESIRKTTSVLLEEMGHEVVAVEDRAAALKQLDRVHFDAALLDLKLNGDHGLLLLPELLKANPQLEVIVCTAYASIETAVEAIRLGAVDYLPKPFTPEQVRQVFRKVTRTRRLAGRVADLESRLETDSPHADLETHEPVMQRALDIAFKAAATSATILICGESGTGKTVLARAIHERGAQRDAAFVTISCPSLTRELLESELFGHVKGAFTGAVSDSWGKVAAADGGTLFLDEIGELPLEIQPKLLRLLQEKEYERLGESKTRRANVRVLAATNRSLEQAIKDGRFREDLYYRLNVIALHLPPLRERRGDVRRIANGYLRFFAAQCAKRISGFSPATEHALINYAWPGNLRELRNEVERAVILAAGDVIEPADLSEKLSVASSGSGTTSLQVGTRVSLEDLEQEHIRRIVAQTPTMEEAAQILGIDPATLYRKRKRMSQ